MPVWCKAREGGTCISLCILYLTLGKRRRAYLFISHARVLIIHLMVLVHSLRIPGSAAMEFDAVGSRGDHMLAIGDGMKMRAGWMRRLLRLLLMLLLMRHMVMKRGGMRQRLLGFLSIETRGHGGSGRRVGDRQAGRWRTLRRDMTGAILEIQGDGGRRGSGIGIHSNKMVLTGRRRSGSRGNGRKRTRRALGSGRRMRAQIGKRHSKLEEIGEFVVVGRSHQRRLIGPRR